MITSRPRSHHGNPPILFVHGMLHGAWCWSEPWRDYFESRGLATEVVNLPGHGGTLNIGRSQRWTSLTQYADALVDMVRGFGHTPILVGHSLGALLIQMRLQELNPPAVILLAPTHPTAFRAAVWRLLSHDPQLFLRLQRVGRPRLAITNREKCRALFFSSSTPEDVVGRCFSLLEEDSQRVCLELLLRPKVIWRSHTRTPVLVLGAGEDGSVPRHVVQRVAALYGGEAEFFEGMGHDLMLEPDWEQVAERIIDWLRERGLAARPGLPSMPGRFQCMALGPAPVYSPSPDPVSANTPRRCVGVA